MKILTKLTSFLIATSITIACVHAGEQVPLTLRGELVPPIDEEAAAALALAHLIEPPATPEGMVAVATGGRIVAKGVGTGSHFGRFESYFVVDLYLIVDEETSDPLALMGSGIILQTNANGSQILWSQTLIFGPDGIDSTSVIIDGTKRFEGAEGMVSGRVISGQPFEDHGWIQTVGQRRRHR